jgi:nucleoside-diphosphate-sugar epimerase
MKVLITGGAGFIGYFTTKELLRRGHVPVICDAFLNYIPPLQSSYSLYLQHRLNDIKNDVEIIRGDIRNSQYFTKIIKNAKPDVIIHLAAIPLAAASNEFSEDAIQINLNGTISLLESIRAANCVRRSVFVSSSFVYGNFQYSPADENHPKEPIDIYGGTKLAGEILTRAFGRRFKMEYSIVRPSTVYGPTDANRRITQVFLENAIKGKPITLHNGGKDHLDFTYVKDTACGCVLAAITENAKNETFNITRGEARSVADFVKILKKYFPHLKTIEIEPDEVRPSRGTLDISKAKKILGYEPEYSLERGIQEYVEFMEKTGYKEMIK